MVRIELLGRALEVRTTPPDEQRWRRHCRRRGCTCPHEHCDFGWIEQDGAVVPCGSCRTELRANPKRWGRTLAEQEQEQR